MPDQDPLVVPTNPTGLVIPKLPTGVPGLDEVLGGGLPEYSFNLIAGPPGAGKTTLAHQIMFARASVEHAALYCTILGEPPLKMLRYQQQYRFFDHAKVETAIHFLDLAPEVQENRLEDLLARVVQEVERLQPRLVVVDSLRSLARGTALGRRRRQELQSFLHRLSLHLATWETTSLLIGEYTEAEVLEEPVSTIADGMLWLTQSMEGNAVIRKLQVQKVRGQGELPGLHGYRISQEGLRVFPRYPYLGDGRVTASRPRGRLSTGVVELDENAAGYPFEIERRVQEGSLKLVYLGSLDLSPAEVLDRVRSAVEEIGARRVVIDSVTGLELAFPASFQEEFRESLYHLTRGLASRGVTLLLTMESQNSFTELRISPEHPISFITDDIILQRYIEVQGELRPMMGVLKMRRSKHSRVFRAYDTQPGTGLVMGEELTEYRGLIHGVPVRRDERAGR